MLSIIAACDDDDLIGVEGRMPWHHQEDLEFFREKTMDQVVIMGRGTWESIGCEPLPGRINIVITSRADDIHLSGATFKKNLCDALRYARGFPGKEIFIIGGEQVFKEAMPLADTIFLTKVPGVHIFNFQNVRDDRYFPDINAAKWKHIKRTVMGVVAVHEYNRIAFDW